LRGLDAGRAVHEAVRLDHARLRVVDHDFDLNSFSNIYSIAIGKAARAMASALSEVLSARFTRGVISAPQRSAPLPSQWQVFAGGHPLPNEASLAAGWAARALLAAAGSPETLIIFVISGGCSAMLQWSRDQRLTLDELRATNRGTIPSRAPRAGVHAAL